MDTTTETIIVSETSVSTADAASIVGLVFYAALLLVSLVVLVWVILSRVRRERKEPEYEDRSN